MQPTAIRHINIGRGQNHFAVLIRKTHHQNLRHKLTNLPRWEIDDSHHLTPD